MAAKGHAPGVDPSQARQAEDLIAAAVGEDRALPAAEGVQTAELDDGVDAGPQRQVVVVGEQDRGAELGQTPRIEPLDRAQGADRHEGRGLDHAVRRLQPAAAGGAVAGDDVKQSRSAGPGARLSASKDGLRAR